MTDSNMNNIILRRRMGQLNGKKLNIKAIGLHEGNYLRKFSIATSLHGIIYLGEPRRPYLERIFWICVTSLVFLMCGYQIRQLFKNWMESEIVTILRESNKLHLTPTEIIPFPGITLCSDLQLQNLEEISISNDTHSESHKDIVNIMCRTIDTRDNVGVKSIEPKIWNLFVNEHRILCEQRVISVTWIRENIEIPCRYFQPMYTIYGICFSMNMVPFRQLLKNGYNKMLSTLNHTKADVITKANEIMWNPEIGFSKNAKPFHIPWQVIGNTISDSITMTISFKKNNLGKHCATDAGMTLFLHSPIEMPDNFQPATYIAVNNIIHITTVFTVRTTSTSVSKWKPEIRHCYYHHERILKFFKIYTINNCEIECRANISLKMCGCVAYYHPRDLETPICGTASYSCLRQYSNNGYSIFNKNVSTQLNSGNDCKCLAVCTEIRYEHNVVRMRKNLTNYVKNTDQQNQDKSIIVMYYKRNIWSVERTALITVNELLGNIGGSLGLFIGASIVSLFEIIYFFLVRLYVDRWNENKIKINKILRN